MPRSGRRASAACSARRFGSATASSAWFRSARSSHGRSGADEIELIRLAAGRIALAVDHGHLYEAETLARGRLTLLAESSEVLGESLDYHSALASLAKLLVPWLADWCLIEVTGERGAGLAAHADPAMISLVEALAGGAGGDRGWVAARVAQSGASRSSPATPPPSRS